MHGLASAGNGSAVGGVAAADMSPAQAALGAGAAQEPNNIQRYLGSYQKAAAGAHPAQAQAQGPSAPPMIQGGVVPHQSLFRNYDPYQTTNWPYTRG